MTLLNNTTYTYDKERRVQVKIKIENFSSQAIFPVKLDVLENKTLSYADDNYFFLPAKTSREISIEIRVKDNTLTTATLELSAWNIETQTIKITL